MTWIARSVAFALLASVASFAVASPAGACTCMEFDIDRQFESADAVFVGTPTQIFDARGDSGNTPTVAVIDVETVFKGSVIEQQAVATHQSGATCGYDFVEGDSVAVFAQAESTDFDLVDGMYVAGLCSTFSLTERAIDFPTRGDPPMIGNTSAGEIQEQLGNPRPSLLPEALIFIGVLVFVLGLASAFTLRDRRRAAN